MPDPAVKLDPTLARKVAEVMRRMAEAGHPIAITSRARTADEQAKLYAQGRSAPGAIVTNADGTIKPSQHQLGRAVDFAFVGPNGQPNWDEHNPWEKLGDVARNVGLIWGGDWRKKPGETGIDRDRPHVQLIDQPPAQAPAHAAAPPAGPGLVRQALGTAGGLITAGVPEVARLLSGPDKDKTVLKTTPAPTPAPAPAPTATATAPPATANAVTPTPEASDRILASEAKAVLDRIKADGGTEADLRKAAAEMADYIVDDPPPPGFLSRTTERIKGAFGGMADLASEATGIPRGHWIPTQMPRPDVAAGRMVSGLTDIASEATGIPRGGHFLPTQSPHPIKAGARFIGIDPETTVKDWRNKNYGAVAGDVAMPIALLAGPNLARPTVLRAGLRGTGGAIEALGENIGPRSGAAFGAAVGAAAGGGFEGVVKGAATGFGMGAAGGTIRAIGRGIKNLGRERNPTYIVPDPPTILRVKGGYKVKNIPKGMTAEEVIANEAKNRIARDAAQTAAAKLTQKEALAKATAADEAGKLFREVEKRHREAIDMQMKEARAREIAHAQAIKLQEAEQAAAEKAGNQALAKQIKDKIAEARAQQSVLDDADRAAAKQATEARKEAAQKAREQEKIVKDKIAEAKAQEKWLDEIRQEDRAQGVAQQEQARTGQAQAKAQEAALAEKRDVEATHQQALDEDARIAREQDVAQEKWLAEKRAADKAQGQAQTQQGRDARDTARGQQTAEDMAAEQAAADLKEQQDAATAARAAELIKDKVKTESVSGSRSVTDPLTGERTSVRSNWRDKPPPDVPKVPEGGAPVEGGTPPVVPPAPDTVLPISKEPTAPPAGAEPTPAAPPAGATGATEATGATGAAAIEDIPAEALAHIDELEAAGKVDEARAARTELAGKLRAAGEHEFADSLDPPAGAAPAAPAGPGKTILPVSPHGGTGTGSSIDLDILPKEGGEPVHGASSDIDPEIIEGSRPPTELDPKQTRTYPGVPAAWERYIRQLDAGEAEMTLPPQHEIPRVAQPNDPIRRSQSRRPVDENGFTEHDGEVYGAAIRQGATHLEALDHVYAARPRRQQGHIGEWAADRTGQFPAEVGSATGSPGTPGSVVEGEAPNVAIERIQRSMKNGTMDELEGVMMIEALQKQMAKNIKF